MSTCPLCEDLGGIAIHTAASAAFGITLWTAHRPPSTSHPVWPCPLDRLRAIDTKPSQCIPPVQEVGSDGN